ncbi:hypothetical protein DPMN_154791 [Dreissena polymorpha]|uniref:Mutator-like transposase domain-containing protein n=1 Tax=Dreissena polymorpha TaxID=45954 RepID=A0A9D4FLS9_DREPO|nr:hypothetical protein DPMN_154791 [Dreissena polymorpha]
MRAGWLVGWLAGWRAGWRAGGLAGGRKKLGSRGTKLFGKVNVPSIDNSVSDASWKVGRRVVELETLAESLSGCSSCQVPINLLNTVGSRDFGLACVLDILCCNCGAINNVATGRKHGRVYDMNTKLALAMVHAGVGVRQINGILSTLNIPAVNHTMLIRRQNEAGQAVEEVAKSSADTFLQEEVHLNEIPTLGFLVRLVEETRFIEKQTPVTLY